MFLNVITVMQDQDVLRICLSLMQEYHISKKQINDNAYHSKGIFLDRIRYHTVKIHLLDTLYRYIGIFIKNKQEPSFNYTIQA